MEIKIDSKQNNSLLNRTEIYFTVKHEGEGTPNREIIRSELAEKLNIKKENIVINTVHSSFGYQEITCYAKVYTSLAKLKNFERDYIIKRNKLIEPKETEKKKVEEKSSEEKPVEPTEEVKEKELAEKPETTEETPKIVEKPVEEPTEESADKPKEELGEESKQPNEGKKE